MNILITGSFGLLGSRITKFLKSQGHTILAATANKNNKANKNFNVVYLDWSSEKSLDFACKNIDVVIHAAGMNAQECLTNFEKAYEFNTLNTIKLIISSKKNKVKKFIFLSTAHVYSENLSGIINEESIPLNNHPYSQFKIAAENYLMQYINSSSFQFLSLRISNVVACPIYIETNCWSLLINNLCYQTATKEYIEIFNKSDVKRDFIPIISFLDILNEILKGKYSKLNGVLNVGSGNTFSLTQIVQIISERYYLHYNKKLKIKFHFNKTKENEILYFKSNRIDFNDHYNFNYLTREIDLLLKFCQLNFKK